MLVNKIILSGGQIASRQELRSEAMNPDLMRQAEYVLTALRAGVPSLSVPITAADGSEIALSLGTTRSKYSEEGMRDEWQKRFPETDPAEYDAIRKQWEEEDRRTSFGLTYQGIRAHYRLVLADATEGDAGILGMVSGLSTPYGNTQESRITRIAREIVELKPAFIPPRIYLLSVFGDHFAIAMLLSDTASRREMKERRKEDNADTGTLETQVDNTLT